MTTAQLEAGKFEGVTTHDKTKRLNVPTPQFKSVEDYGSFAAKVGAQPRAFHRARVNKRTTLLAGRSLGGDDAAAAALGTATSSAADKAADEDEGLEYVLGVDDERWLLNELPTLVRKRLSGQTSAGGQVKGRSHKRANFPTSKAHISAVFHSFRLIFGRAIISRNGLEARMLFPERARADHSR